MQQAHQEGDPIPLDELYSMGADNVANTKTIGIIRSSSAIISLISSSILIWFLKKSNVRFSSTYHRILLGMSIGDICYSISIAHFNSAAPSDDAYYVWNARGNLATCSAQGFVTIWGALVSVYYTCSLNLYSLAVVKYNKPNTYIRTKIEPFLHGVPIAWGLIYNTILLAKKNLNDAGGGHCVYPVYDPPHCIGYDDGEVRQGFEIPCGRGRDGALFNYLLFFVTFFVVPPIIIGVSLRMTYRAVKQQEQVNARYGAGNFRATINAQQTSSGADSHEDDSSWLDRRRSSIRSAASSIQTRRTSRQSSSTSNSRVVQRRAFAFTISYFLTWSFYSISTGFYAANKDIPTVFIYLSIIFTPLQGFFNLCIFLQPKVSKIKHRGSNDTTWCQAVMEAIIWYSGRGDKAPGRGGGRGGGPTNREHQPQVAQYVKGERADSEHELSQTETIKIEVKGKVQRRCSGGYEIDLSKIAGCDLLEEEKESVEG